MPLRSCKDAVGRFNTAFAPVIKPLVEKATELLAKFPVPALHLGRFISAGRVRLAKQAGSLTRS